MFLVIMLPCISCGNPIVTYFKVGPKERQLTEINLPRVTEKTSYQMVSFPMPYDYDIKKRYQGAEATGRLIIHPDKN